MRPLVSDSLLKLNKGHCWWQAADKHLKNPPFFQCKDESWVHKVVQTCLISCMQPACSLPISHLRAMPQIEDGSQMEEGTAALLLETSLETFTREQPAACWVQSACFTLASPRPDKISLLWKDLFISRWNHKNAALLPECERTPQSMYRDKSVKATGRGKKQGSSFKWRHKGAKPQQREKISLL